MRKWPFLNDREWPDDMPKAYLHEENWGRRDIKAAGLVSLVLGLARRVDWLEKQNASLEKTVNDLMQWP